MLSTKRFIGDTNLQQAAGGDHRRGLSYVPSMTVQNRFAAAGKRPGTGLKLAAHSETMQGNARSDRRNGAQGLVWEFQRESGNHGLRSECRARPTSLRVA